MNLFDILKRTKQKKLSKLQEDLREDAFAVLKDRMDLVDYEQINKERSKYENPHYTISRKDFKKLHSIYYVAMKNKKE